MGLAAPLGAPFWFVGSSDCCNSPYRVSVDRCINQPTRYFIWKPLSGPNRNLYYAGAYCQYHVRTYMHTNCWEITHDQYTVLEVMNS